jgi:hypothetical protein
VCGVNYYNLWSDGDYSAVWFIAGAVVGIVMGGAFMFLVLY